jgi:putative transcriptional regulator
MKLRLKQLRVDSRWTQPELAFKLGVSITYVQKLESGKKTPGFKLAKKIADVFGCKSIDEVLQNEAS